MSETIAINDVGPRDGLQNQAKILDPEDRLRLIDALTAAGVERVEIGAFVSPKAVPAMAGADRIVAGVAGKAGDFSVLIPNMKGYELAVAAGARAVGMVLYGSDGMAQANVRMSMQEANDQADAIIERAREDGVRVFATVSVAFECPFDGPTDPEIVHASVDHFMEAGADLVLVADTIGAANPSQVRSMLDPMVARHGAERLGCHFHDTRAMGLANVFAAIESGVRRFDASIGGLGGCPFAPGASGNVATEDVVMMVHQMGFETGIDMTALLEAADLARELTGTAPGGRSSPWLKQHFAKAANA